MMGDIGEMGGEGIPGGSSAFDGEGVDASGASGEGRVSGEGSGEVIDGEVAAAIGVSGGDCGGGDGEASGEVR